MRKLILASVSIVMLASGCSGSSESSASSGSTGSGTTSAATGSGATTGSSGASTAGSSGSGGSTGGALDAGPLQMQVTECSGEYQCADGGIDSESFSMKGVFLWSGTPARVIVQVEYVDADGGGGTGYGVAPIDLLPAVDAGPERAVVVGFGPSTIGATQVVQLVCSAYRYPDDAGAPPVSSPYDGGLPLAWGTGTPTGQRCP